MGFVRQSRCISSAQPRNACSETVGFSSLEWQGSILVEPDIAGGWGHRRGSGRNWWEISVPMNEVHQRRVWDWLCATRVGDRHEVLEQGIVFRVVPVNVHRQVSVGVWP